MQAGEQVDPELHHRRRVQVGAHRGGSGHRVREPEVERELRGLGEGADEDADQAEVHQGPVAPARRRRQQLADGVGLRDLTEQQDPRQQHQPPGCRDQQRLPRGAATRRRLVLEADQEERGQARQLPEDEQRDQIVGGDAADHRDDERREQQEEASPPGVFRQVSGGIDEHHRPHPRDQEQEQHGEAVEPEGELHAKAGHPGPAHLAERQPVADERHQHRHEQGQREQRQPPQARGAGVRLPRCLAHR